MLAEEVPRLSQFAHIKRMSSARAAISYVRNGTCFVIHDVILVNVYGGVGRGVFFLG